MFKNGDRVIAITNGFEYGRHTCTGTNDFNYEKGWKATIEKEDDKNTIYHFDNGRIINGCSAHNFELLKGERVVKPYELKPGDKAVLLDNSCYAGTVGGKIGDIVTILGKNVAPDDGYGILLPNGKDCWIHAFRLGKYEPKKVKVINPGCHYSTYEEWIDKNAPEYKSMWKYNRDLPRDKGIFTVLKESPHIYHSHKILYLIEKDNRVYIIGKEGVEEVTKESGLQELISKIQDQISDAQKELGRIRG
jgi:hypothetical protein